jgi:ATPase family protein associated with various cellular activities (AAA)
MEPAQAGGESLAKSHEQLPGKQEPWQELDHAYDWHDLVLPARELELLRDIPAKLVRHKRLLAAGRYVPRPGVVVLCSGQSGTGKTLAAQILGAELDLPVFQVDVENISSQGRAQTKRLIARALAAAESRDAIVVFERVAALDGDRAASRTRRRGAADELAYLIDVSHDYPGLVIFARRPARRLDPELAERFDVVVGFPLPRSKASRQIWQILLPVDALVSEAELDYLATSFRLTGEGIHSCCSAAAEDALEEGVPVEMRHLARALEQEARKELWRTLLPADAAVSTLDVDTLASAFTLTGGAIRSCCEAAAADAATDGTRVAMFHVARALRQHYRDAHLDEQTRETLELLGTTADVEQEAHARAQWIAAGARRRAREASAETATDELSPAAGATSGRPDRPRASVTAGLHPGLRMPKRMARLRPLRLRLPQPPAMPQWRLPRPRWHYPVWLRQTWDRASRSAVSTIRPGLAKQSGPLTTRRRTALIAMGGILLAAALGFVVARTTGGGTATAALDQHASAGLLRV